MNNCKNCIHNAVCDMASRFVEAFADSNGICTDYKDKSLLIERKALYEKVEELLIGHGYINPDTAIIECLEIIENFPTADIEPERRLTMKEKLIELLNAMIDENKDKNITTEIMADYLIQNGVVVLPCNSDTVSTDCKDYPDCKGCPIDASGGCDK